MNQADTAWMLISTALVLLMTPALAFFYGGLVRKKNAAHLVMLTFTAFVVATIAYFVVGYRIQKSDRLFLDTALMLVAGYVLVGAVCERILATPPKPIVSRYERLDHMEETITLGRIRSVVRVPDFPEWGTRYAVILKGRGRVIV